MKFYILVGHGCASINSNVFGDLFYLSKEKRMKRSNRDNCEKAFHLGIYIFIYKKECPVLAGPIFF